MIALVAPAPIGKPALIVLLLGMLLFVAAVLFVRARYAHRERGAQTARRASVGIGLQGAAFLLAAAGPVQVTLQSAAATAVGQAVLVALLVGTSISMFLSAALAMGRNWSFVARTRRNHDLVTWGPFATIRHPIYTGLFALLLAIGLAFGHWRGLLLGLPFFAIGTWIRAQGEEALLHAHFGAEYEAYAARVKRFLPGLF